MSHYEESTNAPRWLLALVLLAALAMIGVAAVVLLDDELSTAGRVLLGIVLASSGLALLIVVRMFATLRVRVTDDVVVFGFGRVRKSLRADEIVSAAPDPYPWLRYGGWGVRISTGGYRAYSQAFERESVVIHAADQHRYHVTSRHPADLAEAINDLAAAESASP